jgi:hypothetical protein
VDSGEGNTCRGLQGENRANRGCGERCGWRRGPAGRILEDRRASRGCWEKVGLAGVVGGGKGLYVGITGRYQG